MSPASAVFPGDRRRSSRHLGILSRKVARSPSEKCFAHYGSSLTQIRFKMMRNGQKAVKDSDRRGERIERASEGRLRITLADFWAWVHDVLPVAGPVHLQNV